MQGGGKHFGGCRLTKQKSDGRRNDCVYLVIFGAYEEDRLTLIVSFGTHRSSTHVLSGRRMAA